MSTIQRHFLRRLESHLQESDPLIQVILGPRQVGKTTGVLQCLSQFAPESVHYVSSDEEFSPRSTWLTEQWHIAMRKGPNTILAVDEVQKIPNWSQVIKGLWDKQQRKGSTPIRVVLLGSSSLSLQQGLTESLAGRFEVHRVHHWSYEETKSAFGLSLDQYLMFGGYPGAYRWIEEPSRWHRYIQSSIVESVIGKDILLLAQVKTPALFKQAFSILSSYPAQEVSYTKLLGQLQDKGNTDLIKSYIELYEGAFLVRTLEKFSNKQVLRKSSSPKILLGCPALCNFLHGTQLTPETRGRLFELTVGNLLQTLGGELFYWRQGKCEVDFVFKRGEKLLAIEVKSGRNKRLIGLEKFLQSFPEAEPVLIDQDSFEAFSQNPSAFLGLEL